MITVGFPEVKFTQWIGLYLSWIRARSQVRIETWKRVEYDTLVIFRCFCLENIQWILFSETTHLLSGPMECMHLRIKWVLSGANFALRSEPVESINLKTIINYFNICFENLKRCLGIIEFCSANDLNDSNSFNGNAFQPNCCLNQAARHKPFIRVHIICYTYLACQRSLSNHPITHREQIGLLVWIKKKNN